MPKTYRQISADEMRGFLKMEKGWRENLVQNEIVFDWIIPSYNFLLIRVFSGIRRDTQQSRECGKDALRTCCINLKLNKGWIKSKTAYRTQNWRDNLKDRILNVIKEAKERN